MTLREADVKGFLELQNPHERDSHITFAELGHKYFVHGKRWNDDVFGGRSSTTFIHHFFPEFDRDGCIATILRNRKHQTDPSYKYYKMDRETILASWAANGKAASEAGTAFHADVENHQNGIACSNDSVEWHQYLSFRADHPTWVPFRTELMMYDESNRITGSIDALMLDTTDGRLVMVDWKRSKAIKRTAFRRSDVGLFPLGTLPDSNFWHYSLQLNLYTDILRRKYGWDIKLCCLVVCYPTQTDYERIDLPDMRYEIGLMLDYRKLQLMKEGRKHKSLGYCCKQTLNI